MSWLEPLPDAELMRATDAWAIRACGIPSLTLMERAGAGLARVVAGRVPAGRIAIVCGKGNNGGDGLVAARLLRQGGRDVDVLALWGAEQLSGDARTQWDLLPGAAPAPFEPARLEGARGVVDALLGTGAKGAPAEPVAAAIAAVSSARGTVIAADVPSGVDAATGEVAGAAVRAAVTATFHRSKPGLWIAPGKEHAGEVCVLDIGIPPGAPGEAADGLIGAAVLAAMPRRSAGSTKFSSGNVVIVGGSRGLTGAPCLSALGALRTGAGYVTLAAPGSLEAALGARPLEAMLVGLPDADGALSEAALEPALAAVGRADAVVLGPGLGRTDGARALARALATRVPVPLVLDADGLNALGGSLEILQERTSPTVLTPHAGELGRLLEVESAEVGRARRRHAVAAARAAGAIVVLKGDDTLVAAPSGQVAISPGGAPALATAGTGDVLSGVTAAMLAKGMEPRHAACAAVHAHLRAGQLAAAAHGPDGVIASDVAGTLPAALAP